MWTDKRRCITLQKSPFVDFRMRKSTKDRIKPYGYYFIQQISGLLSVNRQPKSGRDTLLHVLQEILNSCHSISIENQLIKMLLQVWHWKTEFSVYSDLESKNVPNDL